MTPITSRMARWLIHLVLGASLALVFVASNVPPATYASPSIVCPAGVPCIYDFYQQGSSIVIKWDNRSNGGRSYDFYQVRWGRPGIEERQHKIGGGEGGTFTLNNVWRNTRYTLKVQGCDRKFLGGSSCSSWDEVGIHTNR